MQWRSREIPTFEGSAGDTVTRKPNYAETMELVDRDGHVVGTINHSVTGELSVQFARPVIRSSAETVAPTADQSGSIWILSHANPSFVLPTSSNAVEGQTEYWVSFVGDTVPTGTVDGDGSNIYYTDLNAIGESSEAVLVTPLFTFRKYHLVYVGSNQWASDLIVP